MREKVGYIYKVFIILFIAVVALVAISKFEAEVQKETINSANIEDIEQVIRDTLVTCYAVEGAYPADLVYLENYGIVFNNEKYVYEYNPRISYELPEITVKLR